MSTTDLRHVHRAAPVPVGAPARTTAAPTTPVPHPRVLGYAGDILRAIASPVRIAIVLQLRETGRCVHELVGMLDASQPLISQHIRVLREAGIVTGKRNGREILYELAGDHVAHIVADIVAHTARAGAPPG